MNLKGDGCNIEVKDIPIGNVWICSGQSNMAYQFTISRAKEKYADELKNTKNDQKPKQNTGSKTKKRAIST